MMDEHFFADVDLPFHVWVRETTGDKARWVLRETSRVQRAPKTAADSARSATQAARAGGG